jgi:hypothetical protein
VTPRLPTSAASDSVPSSDVDTTDADAPFECPRCRRTVTARFYGPCEMCRGELRVAFAREARVVDVAEYEPKMNVTPNAVALKDD